VDLIRPLLLEGIIMGGISGSMQQIINCASFFRFYSTYALSQMFCPAKLISALPKRGQGEDV
jgi:hypothetical protein